MGARFVLVRPRNPLNVGAAARAMANFGFTDLRLVDPHAPAWREARSALQAGRVLARARAGGLASALRGCSLVLGTADRRREPRQAVIPLPALPGWLEREAPGGPVAVLFGPEKTGLSNEDLSHCHAVVRIPTERSAPSMNLGQAVALVAYELVRAGPRAGPSATGDPGQAPRRDAPAIVGAARRVRSMTAGQAADLERTLLAAMDSTGYMRGMDATAKARKARGVLRGLRAAAGDAAFLQGLLRRVSAPGARAVRAGPAVGPCDPGT